MFANFCRICDQCKRSQSRIQLFIKQENILGSIKAKEQSPSISILQNFLGGIPPDLLSCTTYGLMYATPTLTPIYEIPSYAFDDEHATSGYDIQTILVQQIAKVLQQAS